MMVNRGLKWKVVRVFTAIVHVIKCKMIFNEDVRKPYGSVVGISSIYIQIEIK